MLGRCDRRVQPLEVAPGLQHHDLRRVPLPTGLGTCLFGGLDSLVALYRLLLGPSAALLRLLCFAYGVIDGARSRLRSHRRFCPAVTLRLPGSGCNRRRPGPTVTPRLRTTGSRGSVRVRWRGRDRPSQVHSSKSGVGQGPDQPATADGLARGRVGEGRLEGRSHLSPGRSPERSDHLRRPVGGGLDEAVAPVAELPQRGAAAIDLGLRNAAPEVEQLVDHAPVSAHECVDGVRRRRRAAQC